MTKEQYREKMREEFIRSMITCVEESLSDDVDLLEFFHNKFSIEWFKTATRGVLDKFYLLKESHEQ